MAWNGELHTPAAAAAAAVAQSEEAVGMVTEEEGAGA